MANLYLSLLESVPRKGINIPDSEIQKAIQSVKKKEAQEKALDKKVKKLDTVIITSLSFLMLEKSITY